MKTITAKLPHGWFKGKIKETDIIDTIIGSVARWDIVIVETNEIIEREREREFLSRIIRRWVTRWRVMVTA